MKTKELLLLCLFAFISLNINADYSQRKEREIRLERCSPETPPNKGKRSVTSPEAFAYLNPETESIFIDLENGVANVEVSIINLSTNEVVCSEIHSGSEIVISNLSGLLSEGESYRLEISIGDTLLYGYFNF